MMFMVSGRAVNANGSPIVRDGLVAALHNAGHSVTTAQPRRGSFAYVDYLVATRESINRRVTKVRWAAERSIRVIDYGQMWQLINNNIEPEPLTVVPFTAAEGQMVTNRRESLRQEREATRLRQAEQDEADVERLRAAAIAEARRIADIAIAEGRVLREKDKEVEVIQVGDMPIRKVASGPPRRRIVTRR